MNAHELKQLQVQITKLNAEIDAHLLEANIANNASSAKIKRRNAIQKNIDEYNDRNKEPIITEHALLRYIERVYSINLEDVKNSILSPQTRKAIQVIGSGKFPLDVGGRAVVKGNTIVTIED